MNERTSYISVMRGVTVYEKSHFGGFRNTFLVGTYDVAALGTVGNDHISSMMVAPGLEARACSEAGGKGKCRLFRGNVSFVGPDMDNRISWITVKRSPFIDLRRPIGTMPMPPVKVVR